MLTHKELRFVSEYINVDAVDAARRAGYKNSEEAARTLVTNPEIIAAIEKIENTFCEESGRVLAERYFSAIQFLDKTLFMIVDSCTNDRTVVKALDLGYRSLGLNVK